MNKMVMAAVCAGISLTAPFAAAEEPVCPETVFVTEELTKPAERWETLHGEMMHPLKSVSFYRNHPNEAEEVVPGSESTGKEATVSRWEFRSNQRWRYWISCNYHGTSLSLTRPLDVSVSACEVTYDEKASIGGSKAVTAIACDYVQQSPEKDKQDK